MLHAFEEVPSVLHHREVHFHLDLDGTTVHVVRVGASVGRSLSQLALLAFAFVRIDDGFETLALICESTLEAFERRCC